MKGKNRFQQAMTLIDRANACDPNSEFDGEVECPKELLYAKRMSTILEQYRPDASELLQLAARAQHLQRWKLPRSDYEMGRKGYKQWRKAQMDAHASGASELMTLAGYDSDECQRVADLITKTGLNRDDEAQQLQDVVSLVFLQYYFAPFAAKHSDEKIVDIVRKTWRKMSPEGQEAALTLELSDAELALIRQALDV